MDERFVLTGPRPEAAEQVPSAHRRPGAGPVLAASFLALTVLGCALLPPVLGRDPAYMDLANVARRPDGAFWFGTDTMGRDVFAMIWSGGRASLTIGFLATVLSTFIAIAVGAASGLAPSWLDGLIMRLTDVLLSVPSLLVVILLRSVLGRADPLTISLTIGATGWMSIAKVVRTEVRQLRASEYVIAARCMGGGPGHILWRHLAPNFISSIMFMVVMNVRSAIVAESTLSFMGVGLPLETISWGSMLSLAENALAAGAWWIILIPGLFLIATLLAVTELGNALRKSANKGQSNL